MVAILNSPVNDNYSRRAPRGHRVGNESFRRVHATLFARQPTEGSPDPEYAALIEAGC